MLPLGLVGGFHLRMIWEDELEEEMGSRGTEGSEENSGRKRQLPYSGIFDQIILNKTITKQNENLHVNIASGSFQCFIQRPVNQYTINKANENTISRIQNITMHQNTIDKTDSIK